MTAAYPDPSQAPLPARKPGTLLPSSPPSLAHSPSLPLPSSHPHEPSHSDESLLQAFRKGDRSALGKLANRYERALLGLAAGLLDHKPDLAADAIQETWVRVIRFADKFDGRSSFKTWLYRIAINQCRTLKTRVRSILPAALPHAQAALHGLPSTPTPSDQPTTDRAPDRSIPPRPIAAPSTTVPSAAAETSTADDLAWLRSQVARLAPDKRTVLLLCYHEGISHQQAAEILESARSNLVCTPH